MPIFLVKFSMLINVMLIKTYISSLPETNREVKQSPLNDDTEKNYQPNHFRMR